MGVEDLDGSSRAMTPQEAVGLARALKNVVERLLACSAAADEQMSVEVLTSFRTVALPLLDGLSAEELKGEQAQILQVALRQATAWLGFKASLRQTLIGVNLEAIRSSGGFE